MSALITSKENEIKYVTVELLMKDAIDTAQVWQDQRDKVTYGLLKGIETKKTVGKVGKAADDDSEQFILLGVSGEGKVTKACNLGVFNILSFEVYDGIERDITFFRSSEEDQTSAIEMVEEVTLMLTAAKRMIGTSNLINISTFTDLPKDFTSGDGAGPASTTGQAKTYNKSNVVNHQAHAANHCANQAPHVAASYSREKEPTVFKRTSRKPTKAFLEKMKESVVAVTAGKYEPKIPTIKNDKEEEEDDKEGHTQKIYPNQEGADFDYCY